MKIAILNTDESFMEIVRELLQPSYDVVTAEITDLKRCEPGVVDFFEREEPDLVIFDIPPPYVENWNYLRLLEKAYPKIEFLAMTTSKKALESRVGEIPNLVDLLAKPFSLDRFLELIESRLSLKSVSPAGFEPA